MTSAHSCVCACKHVCVIFQVVGNMNDLRSLQRKVGCGKERGWMREMNTNMFIHMIVMNNYHLGVCDINKRQIAFILELMYLAVLT